MCACYFSTTSFVYKFLKLDTFCFIKFPTFVRPIKATQNGSPEPLERCPIYFGRSLFQETCRIRNIGRHVTTDTYLIHFHAVKKDVYI